eukprot:symbB.v1.2.016254.t1/scaffold1233.1/size237523/16
MFFQNGLTGEAWGDWSLYTDSPLRALSPAQEVIAGTGGPFGDNFWDPAGITSKKSKEEMGGARNGNKKKPTDFFLKVKVLYFFSRIHTA